MAKKRGDFVQKWPNMRKNMRKNVKYANKGVLCPKNLFTRF